MDFSNRRAKRLPEVPIIPMIDTMFFLLVFFILTSLNIIKVEGVQVNLPSAKHSSIHTKKAELTLTIAKTKEVYVNGKKLSPGQDVGKALIGALQVQLGPSADPKQQSVVINADGDVPQGMVVQCIDEARLQHLNRFDIATVPPGQQSNTAPGE